jgi:hypothetical protein
VADIPSILKHVMDNSSQLISWALSIGGGTVAVIVSTSYRRPDSLPWRLPYLLFIPGWICIGYSLYLGNNLVGKYLASTMVRQEQIEIIGSQVNNIYADQRAYLLYSLVFFGLWLLIYMLSWIFSESLYTGGKNE